MKRTRLRRESPTRKVEQAVRRGIVAELGPRPCALKVFNVCTGRAEDLHELVGAGAGGSRVDRRNVSPACRRCNGWVEDNPGVAYRLGVKVPSHEAVPGERGLVAAVANPRSVAAIQGAWDA
jgi:hypothetical protein